MEHTMHLYQHPFDMVIAGTKTIDIRINDTKRRNVKIGDKIKFINLDNENEHVTVGVVGLMTFDSFWTFYRMVPLVLCGYSEAEVATASPKDMVYYSEKEERKNGVVGICFQLL